MSKEKFEEGCKGCEPAMIDVATGNRVPDDSPIMKAVMDVWTQLSHEEKEAWHEFTCQNSREPQIMVVVNRINERFQAALEAIDK